MNLTAPHCPYCSRPAELVDGGHLYPHREDLYDRNFWACDTCAAYVGCHAAGAYIFDKDGERIVSDGTLALGRLADALLRAAKLRAHAAFDPLWRDREPRSRARREAYAWLAKALGIPVHECHIGFFDVGQCERVVELCQSHCG